MGVIRHNCGLAVAHSLHDVYSLIASLQHRGRDAAGIAAIGETIDVIKWKGSVKAIDLDDLHAIFDADNYSTFMGHVRYATRGRKDKVLEDAHPHVIGGEIIDRRDHIIIKNCDAAIVHNGQVKLEDMLEGMNDTEALLEFYKNKSAHAILEEIPGSYTLAVAHKRKKDIAVFRDRFGMKPGVLGRKDGKFIAASEEIALRKNGAKFIEDLTPGSIYYMHQSGSYEKEKVVPVEKLQRCFFEWNYIADIDSIIDGVSTSNLRRLLGEQLAEEHAPSDIDIVSYIPRCPEHAARGYADKRDLPFKRLFYKKSAERSFQGSNKKERSQSIRNNLFSLPSDISTLKESLEGKTIYLIDDSTIRGNASKQAISLLEEAGVKKIYLANYTPKIGLVSGGYDRVYHGCEYGVDMPPNDKFVVRTTDGHNNRPDVWINKMIGAETYFMSVDGMLHAFEKAGIRKNSLCTFCIGGDRPF